MEIEIRRTNRTVPVRSKSVSYRINDYEKKIKSSQSHWDYSSLYGKNVLIRKKISFSFFIGPNVWSRIFPQLQCKKFQSPVRIYTNQCEYEPVLVRYPFIFDTDENCCQTLENTGHTFQVSGKGYSCKYGSSIISYTSHSNV
jgi:hypothetical protein